MANLAIRARFPLGVFQGHQPDGAPARFPDTARMLSALVHAAGTGSTAVIAGDDLTPSPQAVAALRWLEAHPPSALRVPSGIEPRRVRAYRSEGVLAKDNETGEIADKKSPGWQSDAIAISDYVGWAWDEEAPDEVVAQVDLLLADVSCLGEADSPVVMELGDIEPTHLRGGNQDGFAHPQDLQVRTPAAGRFDALQEQYTQGRRGKPPGPGKSDGVGQMPFSPRPVVSSLRTMSYQEVDPVRADVPWDRAWAFLVDRRVPADERVRWCVAIHRALVSRLGAEAPAVVTGHYGKGVAQPANRVAIQFVEGPIQEAALQAGAVLVLAPTGCPPAELAALERAIAGLHEVRGGKLGVLHLERQGVVDPANFWLPPHPGMRRRWRAVPAYVPETRRQRVPGWTMADAALVSVGHLFRDRLEATDARGASRFTAMTQQVRRWGVRVVEANLIPDSRSERYVHKMPRDLVCQPVELVLDLAEVVSAETLLALGQSRHLGGGLLYPMDVGGDERRA